MVLLSLQGVSELSLHLLRVPGSKVLSLVFEGGTNSRVFHTRASPSTEHYSNDHIFFMVLLVDRGTNAHANSNTIPRRSRSRRPGRASYPPSTRPIQSCLFRSQDRGRPSSRQPPTFIEQQQTPSLRQQHIQRTSSSSNNSRQSFIKSLFSSALDARRYAYIEVEDS
jgi:hypothetical protein